MQASLYLARVSALVLAALSGCATPPAPEPGPWFIFLETGRKTPDDKAAVAAMQRGHIDNFKRLFAAGQLQAAGPLRDPSGFQRGIVTVRAASREQLMGYFQPDEYLREGYMTVNAAPAVAHKPLNTTGIDDTKIEEVRIVKIARDASPASATQAARHVMLQQLLDSGRIGAWYTLQSGPVAEVLFARTTDTAGLETALSSYPGLGQVGVGVAVWPQWLSPGVVR